VLSLLAEPCEFARGAEALAEGLGRMLRAGPAGLFRI
jgi:hypothetical protein